MELKERTNRRKFIKSAVLAGGALSATHFLGISSFAKEEEKKEGEKDDLLPLIDLPFKVNALEPYLSAKTVSLHYNEHHKAYYNNLKGYIKNKSDLKNIALEDLITLTRGGILMTNTIFHFATLLWNHNFYWQSIKPKGGILPKNKSKLTKQIIDSFGSVEEFKKKFIDRAMKIGIGWIWLIKTPFGIEIVRTDYNDGPIPSRYPPLIGLDLWEHSYYLDYGNDRKKYVEQYLNHLVNWEFAEANLK